MNFNFANHRGGTKFNLGAPFMRHFSSVGLVSDHTNYSNIKPDCLFKNVQYLQHFGPSGVLSNKSFSNPNFVNKENPNILTPLPEKNSSQHSTTLSNTNTNKPDSLKNHEDKEEFVFKSGKMSSKKARKNRKKTIMAAKKHNSCSSPKKLKKEPKSKAKSKNSKPWHKISFDMEIMECDESALPTPVTPPEKNPKESFCVQLKSSPIEILTSNCKNILNEAVSISLSPCSEFLKNISSSSSDYSISPSSPAVRRLRIPSECDSEDSFIVFCDDSNSCMSETEDISSDEYSDSSSEEEHEEEEDFDVVDFTEKTDLNKGTKKKVSFREDSALCEVHPMVKWGFAYHTARMGPWEQLARDRARFECRIRNTEGVLRPILEPHHRDKVFADRFEDF